MKTTVESLHIGSSVNSDFLLKDVSTGTTKRNTQFIKCKLADKTGSVVAVWWDWDGKALPGGVMRVEGQVSEYQGLPQIVISGLFPRETVSDEDFEKTSKYDPASMWQVISSAVDDMESAFIKDVSMDILYGQGYQDAFKRCPAATSMHHAFSAGLLEHTSQMVQLAKSALNLPFMAEALNKDLCLFGIIFHDFGKIFEYEHTGGFKHTLQGRLVPHIPMTSAIIYETCNKFSVPEVVRDHMMHVVLAHHGRMEWGSPVDMAIPEAAFVHYIDNLHGDVFGWIQKIEESKAELAKHGSRNLLTQRFSTVLTEIERREAEA